MTRRLTSGSWQVEAVYGLDRRPAQHRLSRQRRGSARAARLLGCSCRWRPEAADLDARDPRCDAVAGWALPRGHLLGPRNASSSRPLRYRRPQAAHHRRRRHPGAGRGRAEPPRARNRRGGRRRDSVQLDVPAARLRYRPGSTRCWSTCTGGPATRWSSTSGAEPGCSTSSCWRAKASWCSRSTTAARGDAVMPSRRRFTAGSARWSWPISSPACGISRPSRGSIPRAIGVYGGSYGGYMALMAMHRAPEHVQGGHRLRAGHRLEAVRHDLHRALHGSSPPTIPTATETDRPINFAADLAGALLVCHGTMDNNVHLQHTLQLASEYHEEWHAVRADGLPESPARRFGSRTSGSTSTA